MRLEFASAASSIRPALMCSMKVGVSPAWNGAMSHSDSSAPWVGPPCQMPWQQTTMRWSGGPIIVERGQLGFAGVVL